MTALSLAHTPFLLLFLSLGVVQLVDGKDLYALEAFLESFAEFLLENSSSLCNLGAIVNCTLRLRGSCLWPETPLEMYTLSWRLIAAEISKINQLLRLADAFSLLRATKPAQTQVQGTCFVFDEYRNTPLVENLNNVNEAQ